MLGLLAVITYLTSLKVERPASRMRWTLASGFIIFLGGNQLGRFRRFPEYYSLCRNMEIYHVRNRSRPAVLSNMGLYLRSNALHRVSRLSQRIRFCKTSLRIYADTATCIFRHSYAPIHPDNKDPLGRKIQTAQFEALHSV